MSGGARNTALSTRFQEQGGIEVGIDEAGRGPLLGRVYSAAVVLPTREEEFRHDLMKDSKRFTSDKKIREVAAYIKEHADSWGVGYATEEDIDQLNIRQATFKAMHAAIADALGTPSPNTLLVVDGNDFKPYTHVDPEIGIVQVPHVCVERGDNRFTAVAAASILAKVARDDYISDLCAQDPSLDEKYGLLRNKGYGTRAHLQGIATHGISRHHRRTFGSCRLHQGTRP
jgi:ribonuclease HII